MTLAEVQALNTELRAKLRRLPVDVVPPYGGRLAEARDYLTRACDALDLAEAAHAAAAVDPSPQE